jgi:hypothetical protein
MNAQEIFDRVWAHAQTMTERAVGPNPEGFRGEKCLYRTEDGNRCLIGAMIPDELYQVEFEGKPIEDLPKSVRTACFGELIPLSFLVELQACHDFAYNMPQVLERLCGFAKVRNLTIPGEA